MKIDSKGITPLLTYTILREPLICSATVTNGGVLFARGYECYLQTNVPKVIKADVKVQGWYSPFCHSMGVHCSGTAEDRAIQISLSVSYAKSLQSRDLTKDAD